ncbi:SPOR domain-containing protein [Psychromonas ossibalaenae]|uniref:SPOR domain-containing protein n=1 Tax=Psychromonas ossibalaenae TaxID=444922 RepID=UPI00037CDAC8|nr:SPOR domain-containing protein [Psychromonas ossibalaenae]
MASQFKNRLVGVTILATLVVIFLPTIIDGKKAVYHDDFVSTPIQPVVKEHTFAVAEPELQTEEQVGLPETTEIVVDDLVPQETAPAVEENDKWEIEQVEKPVEIKTQVVKTQKPVKEITVKPSEPVKAKMPKNAWTIQLGAFQNAANINALLKKLNKAGFQVHTIPTDVIDGVLTRVFVGPDVSKKKLEKQLPRLKRLTKLQGKLVVFDAVNP